MIVNHIMTKEYTKIVFNLVLKFLKKLKKKQKKTLTCDIFLLNTQISPCSVGLGTP